MTRRPPAKCCPKKPTAERLQIVTPYFCSLPLGWRLQLLGSRAFLGTAHPGFNDSMVCFGGLTPMENAALKASSHSSPLVPSFTWRSSDMRAGPGGQPPEEPVQEWHLAHSAVPSPSWRKPERFALAQGSLRS